MKSISELIGESGRIVRFGIVGIVATAVYAGSSIFAIEILALSAVQASILGQLAAMGVSYFGHGLFSFGVKMDYRTYLWRFLLVAALTFFLNGAVTWLLTAILGLSYRISVVVMAVLIPAVNYVCNRFWVFMPGMVAAVASSERSEAQGKTGHR